MQNPQGLFQSKLSEDYKIQQNRLKEIKYKVLSECQFLDEKIQNQLSKIKETSNQINQAARLQTKIYNQSLCSDQYSTEVIDLGTLSSYLKKQKAHLTDIVASSELKSKQPKSGKDLLHKLSNRKKMQKYLQHLECYKLEKEIQYLEKNILIGNPKNGKQDIIYEDIPSVTLKEESQQIQRLKMSLQELQRIVNLSNQCGGNINNQISTKISELGKQTERLEVIEQILDKQTKEIVQVRDFFKDYQPKQIQSFLNLRQQNLTKQFSCHYLSETANVSISQQEIDCVLNFDTDQSDVKIFKKPFEQVNDLVKTCKNRLKKVRS